METVIKYPSLQPRLLRYRGHQKIYFVVSLLFAALIMAYWSFQFIYFGPPDFKYQLPELLLSSSYFVGFFCFYFFWFKPRFKRSVQVFESYLKLNDGKTIKELHFSEVESIGLVYWSLFYFKMKDGTKFYFNSSLERVDYIWEGIKAARSDLMAPEAFEEFRLKLVQYDHHQKRKEWFFKHKMLDVFNWVALPSIFLALGYMIQSKEVVIYQPWMYFFRLFMYSLIILLSTGFIYSLSLKKFIFDKKIAEKMDEAGAKIRDIEFEGVILHRSKIFQMFTACFLFAILIHTDFNLFSVTKVKEEVSNFELKQGKTIMVDNRFNCFNCKYQLTDGDIVVFGRGFVGQIMAREGDYVGEIAQDKNGRTIASENVQAVPEGHIAVKASNGKDIMFVRIQDVMGKIQN